MLFRAPGDRLNHGEGQLGSLSRLSIKGVSVALRVPGDGRRGGGPVESREKKVREEGSKEKWKGRGGKG